MTGLKGFTVSWVLRVGEKVPWMYNTYNISGDSLALFRRREAAGFQEDPVLLSS